MKKYILIASLVLTPAVAFAWTQEDCEEVNYDHPDCEVYPQPSPSVEPSVAPSPDVKDDGDGPAGVVEVDTPEVPREFGVGIGGSSGQ